MLQDLLPLMEQSILTSAGAVPLVLKGMERTIERSTEEPEAYSRHRYHELTYVRSGRVAFDLDDGRPVVDRGGVIVIRPGRHHRPRVLSDRADMIVLYFVLSRTGAEELGDGPVSDAPLEGFLRFAEGAGDDVHPDGAAPRAYLTLGTPSRQDIASVAERIVREHRDDRYRKSLMMQLLAVELLVVLARGLREEWEESLSRKSGRVQELMRIARGYIEDNHDHDLSVTDMAGYVFLSTGYFTRVFREETGLSPMAYLTRVRVRKACEMLRRQDSKIKSIAEAVGFSSPQRFNAAFRRHTGRTPMAYRRAHMTGGEHGTS